METKIVKINSKRPEPGKIKEATKVIRKGGLIVFPTETVYGLGCDALNERAVAKVFQVKKRDRGKPLLILIGAKKDLNRYARNISPAAKKLIKKYWPGPLTLIFRKTKKIPLIVSGRGKIAVRLSGSRLARELVKKSGRPIIGTSANLSGKKNITSVQGARRQFQGKVDLIIDGGKLRSSRTSTIIDCSGAKPEIVRQGALLVNSALLQ